MKRILIVEDESIISKDIQRTLENLGYEVCGTALNGKKAIELAQRKNPDLVLLDIVLKGDLDGIETAEQITAKVNIPVVYLTAYADQHILQRAKITKPFGYILKPFKERDLHITIEMALDSHKMESRLKNERDRAQLYLDVAGVIIIFLGLDKKVRLINKKGCTILGYEKEKEILGKDWIENFVPKRVRKKATKLFQKLISGDAGKECMVEFPILAKNKKERIISWHNTILFDENGKAYGTLSSGEDITERVIAEQKIKKLNEELEARVIERTAQLEEANKDLAAFSFSISHDLQTPLRAIQGFSKILEKDYSENMDDEALSLLQTIREKAEWMNQLIQDILRFSQFGRQELHFSRINMNKLIESVIEEYKSTAEGNHFSWKIDPLLPVQGDKVLIRQAFSNLVSNAVKFTGEKRPSRIEIACYQKNDQNIYTVTDHGVGFDMEYADKLFLVFQRLHSQKEFKGTGAGLAIAQRIIKKHGGKIWGEGCVNKGATFYVALPAHKSEPDLAENKPSIKITARKKS